MSEAAKLTDDPYSISLEDINVSNPNLFMNDNHWGYFERLRKEDPIHYCGESLFGPFWSVTKFNDIMEIEKTPGAFSSEGGITLGDQPEDFQTVNFISMDSPKHDVQRKAVTNVVAPLNLAKLEPVIRSRATKILDEVPTGEEFDWVHHVSVELTTQMLATLFDFPFEERSKLTYWSDMATSGTLNGGPTPEPVRRAALLECLEVFTKLWNERVHRDPTEANDLITMMAHNPNTQGMDPME
jgi:cytochrome P450